MGKIVIIGAGPAEINFMVQNAAQIDSPKQETGPVYLDFQFVHL